jgi:hypothetical protein
VRVAPDRVTLQSGTSFCEPPLSLRKIRFLASTSGPSSHLSGWSGRGWPPTGYLPHVAPALEKNVL